MPAPAALSAEEVAVYEANAVALGTGLDLLMENAGRAVAEEVQRRVPVAGSLVPILLGTGNNGGDGSTAAYYLQQWGYRPELWPVRPVHEIATPAARRAFVRAANVAAVREGFPGPEDLSEAPLIVDALLGVGHRAPLRSPYREACRAVTSSGVPVLAVDVPTGLGDPDGLVARWTVTFTAPKTGVPPEREGERIVRDVGLPEAAWAETGPGDFLRLGAARQRGARGRGGRVVIVGGGPYAGAPALAGLAALRCGAERATVVTPERVAPLVQAFSPNLVVRSVGGPRFAPEFVEEALAMVRAGPVSALVAGPGAGAEPVTLAFFRELLPRLDPSLPVVVDADALPALRDGHGAALLAGRTVVATPNRGELLRLAAAPPSADAADLAPSLARELGVAIVAKGAADELAWADRTARNRHHAPAQAVAGAGDVLDGVLGALLALDLGPWEAARLGTYWAGEAALLAAQRHGDGLLATDLVEALGEAARRALERGRAPS